MFTTFKCNRPININELREVITLMENQETTDAYFNTEIAINGNYANITVVIDGNGDVLLV